MPVAVTWTTTVHRPDMSDAPSLLWRDLLGRRIASRAEHPEALALSPDGRIALCAGTGVSVLYSRAAVLAALAASDVDTLSLQDLFDDVQRQARGVRAPAVAHVPIDKNRARALAWAEPPVLLSAPAARNAPLRRIFPAVRLGPAALPEGCWGLDGVPSVVLLKTAEASSDGNSPEGEKSRVQVQSHFFEENVTLNKGDRPRQCEKCAAQAKIGIGLGNSEKETTQYEIPTKNKSKHENPSERKTPERRSSGRKPRKKIDQDFDWELLDDEEHPSGAKRKKIKREDDAEYAPAVDDAVDENNDDKNNGGAIDELVDLRKPCVHQIEQDARTGSNAQTQINEAQILCLRYFHLCASDKNGNAQVGSDFMANRAPFVLFGTQTEAYIQRWVGARKLLTGKWQLNDEWTSTVEVAEAVDVLNSPVTKIVMGGPFGRVRVFGVTWLPGNDDDADDLKVELLWNGADDVFSGPVTALAFGIYARDNSEWRLAIGIGTNIAGIRVIEAPHNNGDPNTKRKTQVTMQQNAHYQSVSAVNFLPDGSIISASKDGSISRWEFQWDTNKAPSVLISVVQKESDDLDSVITMRSSPSGILLVVVSSRPLVKGEIGESSIAVKKKYHYLTRSTLLSILAYPIEEEQDELRSCLELALARLLDTSKYADICLTLWDVELWLLANTKHTDHAVTILREHFKFISSQAEEEESLAVATRLRKVALCIATTLERSVANFSVRLPKEHKAQSNLRLSVLCAVHLNTLLRFARSGESDLASQVTQLQREVLEAQYSFVKTYSATLGKDASYIDTCLDEISTKLEAHFPSTSAQKSHSMCAVCEDLPLVAGADEPESFWCANGEYFSRCIKTALPCTDCVPRVCSGCGSKARCEDMDTSYLPWESDTWVCPLCNCELVFGRAEKQLEFYRTFGAS